MAKKPGKLDKHGHNFVIFSQATGQTWNHTSAYHLSTLENFGGGVASLVPWGWSDSYRKTGNFVRVGDKRMF